MSPIRIHLFAEDRAHEDLLKHLIERVVSNTAVPSIKTITARGGHGQVIRELRAYQEGVVKHILGLEVPEILVIAVDANCQGRATIQREISEAICTELRELSVLATPDPHIERWYLADPEVFREIVGVNPSVSSGKCNRDYYKRILADEVVRAGHPPMLGGIEFARELALQMDLYRAGQFDISLRHFIDSLRARLQRLGHT